MESLPSVFPPLPAELPPPGSGTGAFLLRGTTLREFWCFLSPRQNVAAKKQNASTGPIVTILQEIIHTIFKTRRGRIGQQRPTPPTNDGLLIAMIVRCSQSREGEHRVSGRARSDHRDGGRTGCDEQGEQDLRATARPSCNDPPLDNQEMGKAIVQRPTPWQPGSDTRNGKASM